MSIKIVCCYAREDQQLLLKLKKHLTSLERIGCITIWTDINISPGTKWETELHAHLDQAQIILLLISASFLDSDYCYNEEMQRALQRHQRGEARVIPVILRPVHWQGTPLGKLQALPKDGKPVTSWRNQDEAFLDIADEVLQIVSPKAARERLTPNNIWNIPPHHRTPFFTGREAILTHLHAQWHENRIQVIAGLGRVGKTQIAVEYAYRHQHDYQTVLWCLADSREALTAGYGAIAKKLLLPEHNDPDQTKAVQAVIQWLGTHQQWLLILDNADDLSIMYEFLPEFNGHILLTTRASSVGDLTNSFIEVDVMEQDVGTLFLLRRAKLLVPNSPLKSAPPEDVATAREICKELGGLPLALDQAGAYIDDIKLSISEYLQRYQEHRANLLKHRGNVSRGGIQNRLLLHSPSRFRKSNKSILLLQTCYVYVHFWPPIPFPNLLSQKEQGILDRSYKR